MAKKNTLDHSLTDGCLRSMASRDVTFSFCGRCDGGMVSRGQPGFRGLLPLPYSKLRQMIDLKKIRIRVISKTKLNLKAIYI